MQELIGWQWHQLNHMAQTDNYTRLDALSDAQPTVKASRTTHNTI